MSRIGITAVVDRHPTRRYINKKEGLKQQWKKEGGRSMNLEESVDFSILYIYFTNDYPKSSDGTFIYFIIYSYF